MSELNNVELAEFLRLASPLIVHVDDQRTGQTKKFRQFDVIQLGHLPQLSRSVFKRRSQLQFGVSLGNIDSGAVSRFRHGK